MMRSPARRVTTRTVVAAVVALVAFASVGSGAVAGAGARADTPAVTLEIAAGVDVPGSTTGHYVPGAPVPVRVTLSGERAVSGRLRVATSSAGRRGDVGVEELDVELPGGSKKTFQLFPLAPFASNGGSVEVTFVVAGSDAASASDSIATDRHVEFVGVLDGLVPRGDLPAPVEFPWIDPQRRAVFVNASPAQWPASALEMLNTIAVTPGDLEGLDEAWMAALGSWIDQGGHLLLDGAAGSAVEGVPGEWTAAAATVRGAGSVAMTNGAASAGAWSSLVLPASTTDTDSRVFQESSNQFGFPTGAAASLSDQSAKLSSFSSMSTPLLVALLAGYVVLVGPVVFLVMGRGRRSLAIWLIVPLLAATATGAVFAGGDRFRASARAGHLSILRLGPDQAEVTTMVGLADDWTIGSTGRFPASWHQAATYGGEAIFGGPVEPRIDSHSRTTADGTFVSADFGDRDFGVVAASGPTRSPGQISVTVDELDWQRIGGTITNASGMALDRVIVSMGTFQVEIGTLDVGASEEFRFDLRPEGQRFPPPQLSSWAPDLAATMGGAFDAQGRPITVDSQPRTPDELTPYQLVGIDTLATMRQVSTVAIKVMGWTSDYQPPATVGDAPVASGRTLVVQDVPVYGDRWGWDVVRSQFQPVNGGIPVPADIVINNGAPAEQFVPDTLIVGFDVGAETSLVLETTDFTLGNPRVWTEGGWVEVELQVAASERPGFANPQFDQLGNPIPGTDEIGPNFASLVEGVIPAEGVIGGRVVLDLRDVVPQNQLRLRRAT